MLKMIIRVGLTLVANAIGLVVAAASLDEMALGVDGFLIAVLLFTAVMLVVRPLTMKVAFQHAEALGGSTALISTLVALVVTSAVSDSLVIRGLSTWLAATVIVWAACLLGGFLLPWLLLRRAAKKTVDDASSPKVTTWR